MSKEYNEIDDLYKSEMFDGEFEMDGDEMWDELTVLLDEKKRKRPFYLFWLGGLSVFLFALVCFLMYSPKDAAVVSSVANTSQIVRTPLEVIEELNNTVREKANQLENINQESNQLDGANTIEFIERTNRSAASLELTMDQAINNTSDDKGLVTERINTTSNESFFEDESQYANDTDVYNQTIKSHISSLTAVDATQSGDKIKSNNKFPSSNSTEVQDIARDEIEDLAKLTISNKDLNVKSINAFDPTIPKIRVVKFDALRFGISYGVSYYYPWYNSAEDYSETVFSYGQQLNVKYDLSSAISVSGGIEKIDIYEKFRWTKTVVTEDSKFVDTAYYYVQNGIKSFIGDTISSTTTTLKLRQKANHHTLWSIPVGVTFSHSYDRWSIGVQGQVVFNLSHKFDGYTESGDDIVMYDESMEKYKTNIGVMYNLQPNLTYKSNKRTSLNFGLPLRISSSNWFNNEQASNSKWHGIGVQFGISHFIF